MNRVKPLNWFLSSDWKKSDEQLLARSSLTPRLQLKFRQPREQQDLMQQVMVSTSSALIPSYLYTLSFLESHQQKPHLSGRFVNLQKRKLRISWSPPQTKGTQPMSGCPAKLRSTRLFHSRVL